MVFGAGFALGTVRVLWVLPRYGQRTAELLESPVMLAVIVLAARWTVRRYASPSSVGERLVVGVTALALMLAVELTVVLWLRGMTFADYLATRDPVAGTVYCAMLALYGVMPALLRPPARE